MTRITGRTYDGRVNEMPRRRANAPGPAQEVLAPMQAQPNPHRTDARRGKRERLAPGIYRRQNDPDPTRFLIFWSVDGVECSAVFHGTLAQAKKERERKRVKSDAGELVAPNRLRFSGVWSEYESMFESLVSTGEASQRTLDLYRQRYRTHLEKALGNRRIQEVQAKHLSDLLSTLRSRGAEGKSPRHTQDHYKENGSKI